MQITYKYEPKSVMFLCFSFFNLGGCALFVIHLQVTFNTTECIVYSYIYNFSDFYGKVIENKLNPKPEAQKLKYSKPQTPSSKAQIL